MEILLRTVQQLNENDPGLSSVDLKGIGLSDDGIGLLAEALKNNTQLTVLNLECNSIGVDGSRLLAEALKRNTTLRTVLLASNDIGAEGAVRKLPGWITLTCVTCTGLTRRGT
jgi:Ran GTPase-activating protein (RanGAP) involved in mRNA processing and transport